MNQITIPSKLVGQEFKHYNYEFANRIIKENEDEKVSKDFFGKSNMQNDTYGAGDKVKRLLEKMAAGGNITTQEKDFITIFAVRRIGN